MSWKKVVYHVLCVVRIPLAEDTNFRWQRWQTHTSATCGQCVCQQSHIVQSWLYDSYVLGKLIFLLTLWWRQMNVFAVWKPSMGKDIPQTSITYGLRLINRSSKSWAVAAAPCDNTTHLSRNWLLIKASKCLKKKCRHKPCLKLLNKDYIRKIIIFVNRSRHNDSYFISL